MSSKTTTSGACSSSSLRNAQPISSADVLCSVSPRSDPIDPAATGSDGARVELLDHLDHGPVGDPLAVGEAAAADDPHVERGQRFRDEPRLADPGVADDGDELAAVRSRGALPGLADELHLAVAADEARSRVISPAPRAPRRAGAPQPARPCPSAGAARPARSRLRRERARASPRRSGSRRGRRRSAGGRPR